MKIEEQLRRKLRQVGHKYYSEQCYVQRYHQFIRFVKKTYGTYRHPAELGKSEIENNYRVIVQGRGVDFLTPIRNKMKEIILVERSRVDGESTTPVGAIKKQGPVEVRERNPMQPGRVF